ncbi:hypothetical protein KS527_004453 [Salmonella enterica]|nr:hypothetical protein [Salmonella enterica]
MKKIILLASIFGLVSCAKPMPTMETLNASRADGIVVVGYNFTHQTYWLEEGQMMNFTEGDALAWRVCQGWGYKSAHTIDAHPVTKCADLSSMTGTCFVGQQVQTYQCTGAGTPH